MQSAILGVITSEGKLGCKALFLALLLVRNDIEEWMDYAALFLALSLVKNDWDAKRILGIITSAAGESQAIDGAQRISVRETP